MHAQPATILVTGLNRSARVFLSDNLTADGYNVLVAPTGESAWQLLSCRQIDVVLVDLGELGGLDRHGLELISRIRGAASSGVHVDPALPIIVIAPRAGEIERLRIFDRGADDLLQQPYSYPELRARIGALLRRVRGNWGAVRLRVGPLEIDAMSRQAWMDGRPLMLAGREFALLVILAGDPARVFSRDELLSQVWGFPAGTRTRTADVHASRLRRKLAHPREQFVINVWGEGYKLITAAASDAPGWGTPAGEPSASRLTLLAG